MSETLQTARRNYIRAQHLLEQGRVDASDEWLQAAEAYVRLMRGIYEAAVGAAALSEGALTQSSGAGEDIGSSSARRLARRPAAPRWHARTRRRNETRFC